MAFLPVVPFGQIERCRVYPERLDLYDFFDDAEFYALFRFTKPTFAYICNLIREDVERPTRRCKALSIELQLGLTLQYYGSGSFLRVVGDTVLIRHKGTVSKVVTAVINALVSLKDTFIKFPSTDAEINRIKEGFFDKAEMPCIIGSIDCTHVRIQAPTVNEGLYVNRKQFHSINCQAVCNHKGVFINVVADWSGAAHDARICRGSQLYTEFENGDYNGVLVGDSGYPLKRYLLTPVRNATTQPEIDYNTVHSKTRTKIEQAFGRLKRKFACLHLENRLCPKKVCKVFMACCILHNIQFWPAKLMTKRMKIWTDRSIKALLSMTRWTEIYLEETISETIFNVLFKIRFS